GRLKITRFFWVQFAQLIARALPQETGKPHPCKNGLRAKGAY
ncbi:MAG: hypothetical protein ACI96W_003481, partial [Paraglaciecola sp.]